VAVNVQLPAPDFVKVPVLETIPATVASPVPPKIAAVVSVMAPDAVAALALLFTKDPLTVNSSVVVYPFKSTKAFNAIVVAVVVPKAALLPSFNVPTLTVAAPLNVLTPLNIQVPVPFFVNVNVPLITPDAVATPVPPKIVAALSMISPDAVAAFAVLFTKEPLIVNGSAVVKPFKSTVAPNAIVVAADVVLSASLLPSLNVPALIVVIALYVFTPLNNQVLLAPVFVNVPVPLITPDAVATPAPVPPKIAAVVRVISPDAVAAVALLFTKKPLSIMGSAVVEPFKSRVAPNAIVVAVDVLPKALLLPTVNVPVLTVVAPT